ncbi:MAG: AAA family ATPase [Desulfovibrionaceae bacterium]
MCEGYATAASIHLATGHAVLCAFNAGNLLPVAEAARALYPQRRLILCADNDVKADATNVGLDAATAAAQAVNGLLAVPPAHEGKACDFNDLHQWRGFEAVLTCIEEAKAPHNTMKTALRVLDLEEMLTIEMPPREYVVHPVIPEQGLCLLYAARGVGKTHIALSIAYAVASGDKVLKWTCPKPRQVLYVDGEMPFTVMQERLAALVRAHDIEPDPHFFRILTPDMQGENPMPNLATSEGQDAIAPYLDGVSLVVIDNLATLCRSGRANDEESWLPVQAWILELRRRGISVLLVHHASKNGGQRGTSAKEDVLDTVINLSRPKDYNPEEGARFEVHLTKARGIFGPDAEPFEARLESDSTRSYWTVRSIEDALQSQVRTLANDGMTQREIATELDVSKSNVNRLCKKFGIDTRGGK